MMHSFLWEIIHMLYCWEVPPFSLLGLVTACLFLALFLLMHLIIDALISPSGRVGQCHRSFEPVWQQINQISKGLLCSGITASGYAGKSFGSQGSCVWCSQCPLEILKWEITLDTIKYWIYNTSKDWIWLVFAKGLYCVVFRAFLQKQAVYLPSASSVCETYVTFPVLDLEVLLYHLSARELFNARTALEC